MMPALGLTLGKMFALDPALVAGMVLVGSINGGQAIKKVYTANRLGFNTAWSATSKRRRERVANAPAGAAP